MHAGPATTAPISVGLSPLNDSATFTFAVLLPQCNTYTINISNALADSSGELLVAPTVPPVVTGLIPPPAPTLDSHTAMTTGASVTITGSAPGATFVEVSVPMLPVADPMRLFTVPVTNNTFTAGVTLAPDSGNAIFFTSLSTCSGVRSPPVMTAVTHDTVPPEIFIDFPLDGAQITTATTDVAGRVGDMLSGFMGLTVTVNGNPAIVDVGIGNNGTFFLQNVLLGPIDQPTVITAVATDELGNTLSKQITATRVAISASTSQMAVFSGNNQTGQVLTALSSPIVVQMFDTNGTTPFANKIVTFKVTRSDGRLGATAAEITPITDPFDPDYNPDPGVMLYQVRTDANGKARAYWRMGHDAGCGNNRVEVTSMSIEGTVAFCASASAAIASQLNIGTGNSQRAEAGGPAPEPLRVWVSDGQNGKCGTQVTFTVTQGGGTVTGNTSLLQCGEAAPPAPTIASGQSVTVFTGRTGHAEVSFTLGPDPGNNVVEATVVPDPMMLQPARFVTFGVVRDEATPTSFMGLVLNNASQPIGGATCSLTVGATALPSVTSDVNGRFAFDNLSMAGPAHLFVDGSTATTVNGQPISADTYPSLPYEPVIIPNAANSLATPVLLPPLETTNGVLFDNTQDITLILPGMDGLEMLVRARPGTTATKADGTVVNAANPITLMLSQVHADDIPMPIPDGASPPFAWTLQPSGTVFDPPITITYPNMSGLPPGSIAYFLSFNHATSRFEIVATGHVTDDGSTIVTDPGAGLSIAGWGCNCPPYSVTGDCCTGCNEQCCDGSCCCGACCAGPCCNDVCCPPGGSCCNGSCCVGPCCNDVCCPAGQTCCNGVCCDGPCCGDECCPGSESCCGDECCDGPCCEGVCCPEGGSCCDGKCCQGLCCEGECCAGDDESCCDGQCCEGPCCEESGFCCPSSDESCCNEGCCPGPCCGLDMDICCEVGESCCGLGCCPPDTDCCDTTGSLCCPTGMECCDEKCCLEGWTCCNGVCCPGPCCENTGECCAGTDVSCCNDMCCDGECCNDVCCAGGGICCDDQCCPAGSELCCGTQCCPSGTESCCDDMCCAGPCCGDNCCPADHNCCGKTGCCPEGDLCCAEGGGGCCPPGTRCCGEECCEVGITCCDGACCPAGQSCCGGSTCCEPDKCCGGVCCAANEACCPAGARGAIAGVQQVCVPSSCSLSVQPGEGCAGSTVELTLTGDCDPDCDTMSFSMNKTPQFLTVNLPGSVPCLGSPHERTFTVNIDPDAPPGDIVFQIIGTTSVFTCSTLVTVTVIEVDLDIDSDNNNGTNLPDRTEDMIETTPPGKLLCVNDDDDDGNGMLDKDQEPPPTLDDDLVRLVVEVDSNDPGGKWRLQYDAIKVQVYEDDRATIVPPGLAFNLPVTPNPKNFWIEGLAITPVIPTTIMLSGLA